MWYRCPRLIVPLNVRTIAIKSFYMKDYVPHSPLLVTYPSFFVILILSPTIPKHEDVFRAVFPLGIIVLFTRSGMCLPSTVVVTITRPSPLAHNVVSVGRTSVNWYPTIKDRRLLSQSTVPIFFPLEKGEKEDNLEIQVLYQAGGVTEAEIKSEKTRAFLVTLVGKIRAETVSHREPTRDCDLVHVED